VVPIRNLGTTGSTLQLSVLLDPTMILAMAMTMVSKKKVAWIAILDLDGRTISPSSPENKNKKLS